MSGSRDEYRLLTDPAGRRRYEGDAFFVVEGYLALEQAMASGHEVRSLLLLESRIARIASLVEDLRGRGVPIHVVERAELADLTGFDAHRGVLASFTRRPTLDLATLAARSARLVVLEGLNDYENVGAIARAARALRFEGLVLDPRCTDPYNRRAVRVSLGQVLHLPIARPLAPAWPAPLEQLHAAGFETWALTPAPDAEDLWGVPLPERLALVLGAEGPGLSPETQAAATRRVQIPIEPSVDSLNVAQAAAVAMAAATRPGSSYPR